MRLYIGKNHSTPVQSIFRLAGSDEDALTYALGFLLARDHTFCAKFVRLLGVTPRHTLEPDYSVHLQEVTDRGFGRRDIVIESSGMRIVVEAKIGGAEPTVGQLLKYATKDNKHATEDKLWKQFKTRLIVALTQVELTSATREEVRSKLRERGICFGDMQWHKVVELALDHRPSDSSEVTRYLFNEFTRYIRRDYSMGYHDAEILIQDVNPYNAKIFEENWMYVANLRDKKAPLYFAPYFTNECANPGISKISRVMDSEIVILANKEGTGGNPPSSEHRGRWCDGLSEVHKWGVTEALILLYLDRPITIATTPVTKKSFKQTKPPKQIPNQIPKGFSLRFDELLRLGPGIGEP